MKVKDYYFKKAKEERYYARSVYKLVEIDRKYHLLKKGLKVLDIGCTPGSWSQYILETIGNGRVLGIDIDNNIQINDKRFTFIHDDIFNIKEPVIKKEIGILDMIFSDAAPNTTGNKFMDAQKSLSIVKRVFQIANGILKSNGSVVAKVFQGEDVASFVKAIRGDFSRVTLCKPKSSRKESREIFIVAQNKRFQ